MVFLVGFCFFRMKNLALTSERTQMYWERRSTARVHQCCCINAVTFVFKSQFLAHFPFPAKFIIVRIWDRLLAIIRYMGKIWDGREKVKFPIVWDFPDIWKTGFIWYIGRIWDGRQKEKSPIVWDFSDIRKNSLYLNKFTSLKWNNRPFLGIFFFFSSYGMDKLGKIPQLRWKECL